MGKKLLLGLLALMLFQSVMVFASEEAAIPKAGQIAQVQSVSYFTWTVIVAMMGLVIAASCCGIAQGSAIKSAIESIARQPETAPKIQLILMIGLAFIESLVLYTLFVGIILLFVNPFSKYFIN